MLSLYIILWATLGLGLLYTFLRFVYMMVFGPARPVGVLQWAWQARWVCCSR
jgi:hypothetical protein